MGWYVSSQTLIQAHTSSTATTTNRDEDLIAYVTHIFEIVHQSNRACVGSHLEGFFWGIHTSISTSSFMYQLLGVQPV